MSTRRDLIQALPVTGAAFAVGGRLLLEDTPAAAQQPAPNPPLAGHFHPLGKAPSRHTAAALEEARRALPFSDTRDFEENRRGLIAPIPERQIRNDSGGVAFDMDSFNFIDQRDSFDSIHPSMQRIAKLNQNYGLYEVIPGIYQIRGIELVNITFVRGRTGWIVFDIMMTPETARTAWQVFQQHRGQGLPISAVIYSHNHVDHWGGVRGLLTDEEVRARNIPIIAPVGFLRNAIEENVYAGTAMNRRLSYQYGQLLPVAPHGFVTQGLGHRAANGTITLIPPNRLVERDIEEFEVDGVPMVFQNTPNTEAPSEMNTYIPGMKALWMAENVSATLHNIYTLRGAPIRDSLRWSKYINEALYRFGQEAEVMFTAHHWPRWGNARVQEVLRAQRDLYANMTNQVLHYANQGVTINQIHTVYKLPEGLANTWHARGYHGSPEHNSRGVIQRFLGFWDCNPATLIPLTPEESAPLYVEMMGGADRIMARARALHDEGRYQHASEILNRLAFAEPQNRPARELLADVWEQIGYQQENPGLRNSFLNGAYELRSGLSMAEATTSTTPEVLRAMSTELFLNFLAIRMDPRRAEGLRFTMNLVMPDNGERFIVELSNATLTNIQGHQAANADLTLTVNRSDLNQVLAGQTTLEALIGGGAARVQGDASVLTSLASLMVDFDPRFEVLPGTRPTATQVAHAEAYTATVGAPIPE
ncbi:alkyl/aryl-sulfatase [Methylobacterium sp. NEAU K]|uniref:alkyl/aryl-sulfatase n=1 Tax=Methylobacterium sp. NEAU K TaxID=3064946 RepID=UPI0027324E0A|nr:alkyl sulfatase dimerization domain-containing protein [Methylobacterium sp. NEAU K]MDP4006674.1 alkyl sulfatase dimerization domain-containing protein [Methylobacterium sp. NEAU K]